MPLAFSRSAAALAPAAVLCLVLNSPLPAQVTLTDVYVSAPDGRPTYRIPSLLATPGGGLLAFCERRNGGRGDAGDIDLVVRRSTDRGATWGPVQVLVDDGPDFAGNPCPVVDRRNGAIHLLFIRKVGTDTEAQVLAGTSRGTSTVWVMRSNDGLTWSQPRDLTATAKAPNWTWYAVGPGIGIQLRNGRLLVPANHAVAGTRAYRSHVVISDDGGETWTRGGDLGDRVNEAQAVELSDGSVMINMRSYHGQNRRAVAVSRDGGATWGEIRLDPTLLEPVCQAGLIRLSGAGDRLLFTNPASTRRERMLARLSEDGGMTWPREVLLHAGPAAYSSPAELPGGELACLFERGERDPYERISLARFRLP